MKKILILLFVAVTCIGYAQKQDEKKENSHWSITLEGGVNRFDGDVNQSDKSIDPTSNYMFTLGGSIEYTLTPVWSMGVEYYYLPLKAQGTHFDLNDKMHAADMFLALNFIKWFYPNSQSKWGLWATLGGGAALYNVNYQTESDGNIIDGKVDEDYVRTNRWALTVPVGVLIEYNFSKNFALGTKIQYRSYNKDNLDGRIFYGVTNDFVSLGTLQLRWKFNAHKKDHTRNINTNTFNETPEKKLKNDPDKTSERVDSLEKRINNIEPQLKKLSQLPCDGPDTDGDGVPDCRDQEPNTPKGLRVNFQGVGIRYSETGRDSDGDGVPDDRDQEQNTPKGKPVDYFGKQVEKVDEGGFGAVYFDFDKYDLDAEAQAVIRRVAEIMTKDPAINVEVRGYCDFLGNEIYNTKLSQRRSDTVTRELVEKYGIARYRIISNGKGKLTEPRAATRLNRRCNFFFDK